VLLNTKRSHYARMLFAANMWALCETQGILCRAWEDGCTVNRGEL
jgi:hypothetical protein